MAGSSIGIFLFPEVEELDWAGPWEVLRVWQLYWPGDGAHVFTLAQEGGPVECAKGLKVLPDHTWDDAPPIDVLVYPGGQGTRHHLDDEVVLGWLKKTAAEASLMTSVCTGSLVFAAAGLLDNRPATTHWSTIDVLGRLGQNIEVRPDDRFVDDGDVITSAGVSAGIDMALHLVARLSSRERAAEVRRAIQYDPEPPV
jgi:transcriptional regulator GlxA family with amidase domain